MGPFTARGYLERGVARLEKGENDAAMRDFDEAIRRTPHYAKAFYYRALLKSRLNDAYSAVADAESAVKWRGKKQYPEAAALLLEQNKKRQQAAQANRLAQLRDYKGIQLNFRGLFQFFERICFHYLSLDSKVSPLVMLPDSRLISGSSKGQVTRFNLNNMSYEAPIPSKGSALAHEESVYALAVLPSRLASGSADKTIKVWNPWSWACEATLTGHQGAVRALVALPNADLASGSEDNTIKLWNLRGIGSCTATLTGHSDTVFALAVLPARRLVSGSGDKTIKLWKLRSKACVATLTGHSGAVHALVALPNAYVASGSDDKTIKIWNTKSGTCITTLTGHQGAVRALALLRDGSLLSASDDNTIKQWNLKSGVCEATLTTGPDKIAALIGLPDGRFMSGSGNLIKRWEESPAPVEQNIPPLLALLQNNTVVRELNLAGLPLKEEETKALALLIEKNKTLQSIDAANCGISDTGGTLLLQALEKNTTLNVLRLEGNPMDAGIQQQIQGVFQAREQAKLARQKTLADARTQRLISLRDYKDTQLDFEELFQQFFGCGGFHYRALDTKVGPLVMWDGCLVSGSSIGDVTRFNLNSMKPEAPITSKGSARAHEASVYALAVLPDYQCLASGSADKTIKLWEGRECTATLTEHQGAVLALAVLPARRLASGSEDNTIKIWDLKSGTCEATLTGHQGAVHALVALPNNDLVSGSLDTTIKIWDLKSGTCKTTLTGHLGAVRALVALPNNDLMSGSLDTTIKIWDLKSGTCNTTLTGHQDTVCALAMLSYDCLASGSSDKTIKLWNLKSGTCNTTLTEPDEIAALIALPDGSFISAAGNSTKRWKESLALTGQEFPPLFALLQDNTVVRGLSFIGLSLKEEETQALAQLIEKNRTLQSIDAANCGISDTGGTLLLQALEKNTTLNILHLEGNPMDAALQQRIQAILQLREPSAEQRLLAEREAAKKAETKRQWQETAMRREPLLAAAHQSHQDARLTHLRTYTQAKLDLASLILAKPSLLSCFDKQEQYGITIVLPDGNLASGMNNGEIQCWNPMTGQRVMTLKGHFSSVHALAVLADGSLLSGGPVDNKIKRWDLKTGQCLVTLCLRNTVALAVLPDESIVSAGAENGSIQRWNLTTRQHIATLRGHTKRVFTLAMSQEDVLVSVSEDGSVKRWDVKTNQCIDTPFSDSGEHGFTIAILPDGRFACSDAYWLSESEDEHLSLFDPAAPKSNYVNLGGGYHPTALQNGCLIYVEKPIIIGFNLNVTVVCYNLKRNQPITSFEHDEGRLIPLPDGSLCIETKDKIERWDIPGPPLPHEIPPLLQALEGNKSITELTLANLSLQDGGVKALADLVRNSKTLLCIDCSHTGMTNADAEVLLAAVQANTSLKELRFEGNSIELHLQQQLQNSVFQERQRREQVEIERLRQAEAEAARQKALIEVERLRKEQARKQAEAEAERLRKTQAEQARQKALIEAERLRQEQARKQAEAERLRKAQAEQARQQALAEKIKRLSESGPKKLQSGDNAGALSDYNELLLLTPGNAEAFRDRGLAKMNLGKFAEAIDDFEKAIVLKMGDFPAASALLEIARRKLADATVTPPPPAAVPSQIGSPAASPPQGFAIIPYAQLKFTGRVLGEGGFGKVSEAEWQFIKVAVKQLKKSQLTESSLLEFRQEAERHGALRHPHIVALYAVCLEQAKYCMVMELMARGSLYQLLHTAQDLPWHIRLSIAKDIVVGLAYLHDQQIIHCDLKSLNVLLDGNLRAKLADFGLSKVKSETASTSSAAASTDGTLLWMAPELFDRGGKCSYASDIYALAVTLWELSSRKLPFADAASPALVMQWVREGEREAIPAETPPQLAHLIGRGWVKCPADRPTAKQIAEQLMQKATEPTSTGYQVLSS